MSSAPAVYTIGHSTHSLQRFMALLEQHRISALADIRSMPYSRRYPQFNRETLRDRLRGIGIGYVFLGSELGGRGDGSTPLSVDGRVQYRALAATKEFAAGISRLRRGSVNLRIVLMCSEGEPLSCHRSLLVGRELTRLNVPVMHILPNGDIEDHCTSERRLLTLVGLPQPDELFRSDEDAIADAYALQEARVAYLPSAPGERTV